MKKIYFFVFVVCFTVTAMQSFGQIYEASGWCQDTNNANGSWASILNDPKRAVFTFTTKGNDASACTGTLVNQNVVQNNLQQIFITARHCVNGSLNFNTEWDFYFNYQSPDGSNSSVPDVLDINGTNRNAHRYYHRSKVTLIDDVLLSDFAILKINTPIPPHYNVYYAGWTPHAFQVFNFPLHDIHHPQRDIKKIAKANVAVAQTAYGCYVITEVLDVILNALFGWATKKEIHTRTVCSYMETPFYLVPAWVNGVVEHGSSGSALINNDGRIIGTLTGGLSSCDVPVVELFGRFHSSYNLSGKARQYLNPLEGLTPVAIDGRQINTYPTLLDLSGEYYPARDYQPTNQIKLKASGVITTSATAPLNVRNGADFIFESSQTITLRPGFTAQAGSTFSARIVPPGQRMESFDPEQHGTEMLQAIAAVSVPNEMEFDAQKYIPEFKGDLGLKNYANVYPNPSKGIVNVDITFANEQESVKIKVLTPVGQEIAAVWKENFQMGVIRLDLSSQPKGIYFVQVQSDSYSFTKSVVLE